MTKWYGNAEDWFYRTHECAEAWWNGLTETERAERAQRAGGKGAAIEAGYRAGEWRATVPPDPEHW